MSVVRALRWCVPLFAVCLSPHVMSGQAWLQYNVPEDAGFDAVRLEAARRLADSVKSGAVMVVVGGGVVAAWGDVARPLELHSVRKSVLSALYGMAIDRRAVDINRTLASIGIDELTPLTPGEGQARIRDLLTARSGVYLPAAYAASDQDAERPARGSHAPNTNFFYNNWDFNVAGVIYERLVEPDLYAALRTRLAKPLGMEDLEASPGRLVWEPSNSLHPAHTMRMSARDLARFGQLYLQEGRWQGKVLLSPAWIRESTKPVTNLDDGRGYGHLWWTYAPGYLGATYPTLNTQRMFAAVGTGGQFVLIVPGLDLVFVHRGDTDNGREVRGRDVWRIAEMVASARGMGGKKRAAAAPLTPTSFASQAQALPHLTPRVLSTAEMDQYVGVYALGRGATARVFVWKGRLFMNFAGVGEAEMLGTAPDEFTIRPVAGVRVVFGRDSIGRVTQLSGEVAGRAFRGARQ